MRLIDADHLIGLVRDATILGDGFKQAFIAIVRGEPTIEPERKTGKWITSDDVYETGICSCCRYDTQEPVSYVITNFEYCPNCGAKMEEPEDIPMEYFESGGR